MGTRVAEALTVVVAAVEGVVAGLLAREVGLWLLCVVQALLRAAAPVLRRGAAPAGLEQTNVAVPARPFVAHARAAMAAAGQRFVTDGAAGLRRGLGHSAAADLIGASTAAAPPGELHQTGTAGAGVAGLSAGVDASQGASGRAAPHLAAGLAARVGGDVGIGVRVHDSGAEAAILAGTADERRQTAGTGPRHFAAQRALLHPLGVPPALDAAVVHQHVAVGAGPDGSGRGDELVAHAALVAGAQQAADEVLGQRGGGGERGSGLGVRGRSTESGGGEHRHCRASPVRRDGGGDGRRGEGG